MMILKMKTAIIPAKVAFLMEITEEHIVFCVDISSGQVRQVRQVDKLDG